MAYRKTYRTVVPIEIDADIEVARWLARESFENTAAADCLQIVEYTERELAIDDIPPRVLGQLGRPLSDFRWFEFTGVGELNQPLFDWLSAEITWRNTQIVEWLDAEKTAVTAWLYAEKKAQAAADAV